MQSESQPEPSGIDSPPSPEACATPRLTKLAEILGLAEDDLPPVFLMPQRMPLKIGIREDLLGRYPDAKRTKLRNWLSSWCMTTKYLTGLTVCDIRHDLDGSPAGEVLAKDREAAADTIAKRATQASAA